MRNNFSQNTNQKGFSNPSSDHSSSMNQSNHSTNNIDIDDLLADLNQLSSPIIYTNKGFHPSSSSSQQQQQQQQHPPQHTQSTPQQTNNNPFHQNQERFSPNISVNTREGTSGFPGDSFFANYPTNTNSNSGGIAGNQIQHSSTQQYSNQNGTFLQPHPPKNRSPVQVNPKNKFAVLPETGSRGVSPITIENNHQNQNQSMNSLNYYEGTTAAPAKTNTFTTSVDDSNYHFTSQNTMKNNHNQFKSSGRQASSTSNNTLNDHSNQSFPFASPPTNQKAFPEIEKTIAFGKSRSARNSFDEKTFNNIFEELNLNDRPPMNHHSLGFGSSQKTTNNNHLRSVSHDSWDDDSYDTSSTRKNKNNDNHYSSLHIPQVKGSQPMNSLFPSSSPSSASTSKFPSSSSPTTPSTSLTPLTVSGKTRCSRVILAGSHIPRGIKSSAFSKVACDSLLCSQCNFKVLTFPDSTWDSMTIDYMFFRNNMPNIEKLQIKLLHKDGYTAYCCQCQWCEEKDEKVLTIGNLNEPKWICSGHST